MIRAKMNPINSSFGQLSLSYYHNFHEYDNYDHEDPISSDGRVTFGG